MAEARLRVSRRGGWRYVTAQVRSWQASLAYGDTAALAGRSHCRSQYRDVTSARRRHTRLLRRVGLMLTVASRRSGRRARGAALSAVCALIALAGCADNGNGNGNGGGTTPTPTPTSASPTAENAEARITIRGFAFIPPDLKVRPGEKITVVNEDSAAHTVTATEEEAFDTGNIAAGESATFTAPSKAGSYPFVCTLHPSMTGTLTVG